MNLFYRTLGEGKPLYILHGLFGSSDNWMAVGKEFAKKYHVVLVDLRNHGRSPQSEYWDYPVMAHDICELAEKLGHSTIHLMGHSMGGKVGMTIAGVYHTFLHKLVVVDIAPKYFPIHHRKIIDGLLSINLQHIKKRLDADQKLAEFVPERSVRQFLLKNLERVPGNGWKWRINLEMINNQLENVGATTIPANPISIPSLFIQGVRSNYINDEDSLDIKKHYLNGRVVTIENAGHWPHVENPEAFNTAVLTFLED